MPKLPSDILKRRVKQELAMCNRKLEHQIEIAKQAGLTEFAVVGNPQNIGKIGEIVSRIPDIKVEAAIQEQPLGIANAFESASRLLDCEIIVVNPNDVFDASAY